MDVQPGERIKITLEERSTLWGLTRGCVLSTSVKARKCVVFGQNFLSWLPCLESLQLDLVMVILQDSRFLTLVEELVPESCIIWVGTNRVPSQTRYPNFASRSVLGLWEGGSTPAAFQLFDRMGLSEVLSIGSPRKTPSRWCYTSESVDHHACGGVTTATHRFTWFRTKEKPKFHEVRPSVSRDLSTVLSFQRTAQQFCRAPEAKEVYPLHVCNLHRTAPPCFHSGGLLPAGVTS
mmetsp:Transcript_23391/g.35454  ORF Transcript_23391/g.35454 Transcript_23391/m.35454 type:complete len:235 (+) Transcript_23391:520-1224(+)